MPPKPKFTREEITAAALRVISRNGITALTAQALGLFRHVWIYTYGIASLCANGMCRFSEEEIIDLLGQDFMAMLARVKNGGINQPTPHPMLKP